MKIHRIINVLLFIVLFPPLTSCTKAEQPKFSDITLQNKSKTGAVNFYAKNKTFSFDIVKNNATIASMNNFSYVDNKNIKYVAGLPVKSIADTDHGKIYQEGWFELNGKRSYLYYILRCELGSDGDYVKIIVTISDRHDKQQTELQSDKYWGKQVVSNVRFELDVPAITKQIYIEQHNPFDYKLVDNGKIKPYIELEEKEGSPYYFTESIQGIISKKQIEFFPANKSNYVRFYPLQRGTLPLSVIWNGARFPPYAAYQRGKGIVAKVHQANGTTEVKYDQDSGSGRWQSLGTYNFDEKSYVDITAERAAGAMLVDAIKVGDQVQHVFNRYGDELGDGSFALMVKDFWRNYPISMELKPGKVIVEFIKEPAVFMGGMGKTFEIVYSFGDHTTARKSLYQPPVIENQDKFRDSLFFSTASNPVFSALEKDVARQLIPHLDNQRSVGWKDWGDYRIGTSYGQTDDWGNLQYDLPYGLLTAFIRTRDPELWHIAQASLYHLMDIDMVKFSPFAPKYNGSVHRKGEMHKSVSHITTEPVVPQNFAFRSLYLYYQLTGDPFALECARMSVNNFLEFTINPTRIDFASHGDRDTAWIVMGLVFGHDKFGDKKYLDAARKVIDRLMEKENVLGHLPGEQPVWQGQMVEALIKYFEATGDERVQRAIVRHVKWLRDNAIKFDHKTGKVKLLYNIRSPGTPMENNDWTDETNYLFLWLNSFAYVAKVTNDPSYMALADRMFEIAAKDQEKFKGARFVSSYLSFPYYYLEQSRTHKKGK